jgi:hypothetical protein
MSKSEGNLYQELEKEIGDLERSIGKYAPDACERTVLLVLKDRRVREAIVKEYIDHEMVFQSVSCKGELDQTKVNFAFQCRPPRMCIIAHIITVTYDVSMHKVMGIDHFP